ncbi:MAG: hypothetical protein MUF31_05450 [Akkermansiaceae bacterium]|jgi:hypothetical protein|nr:hypothetical protein [Akkermansiaceae bacterium]
MAVLSHPMSPAVNPEQLERCWQACWTRARRPVEGVLISEDEASSIAERSIRNVSLDFDDFPGEAEFTARALEEASRATRELVAQKRRTVSDPQIHHDPEDHRYDRNLDLDRLKKHDDARGFHDREWNHLPSLLRPLALHTLSRKGITGPDAEEIFNDTLVELSRQRENGHAPILDPTVFEELIPLHTRIVGFRAIDWFRKRGTLKNKPNSGESFDALTGDPDHAMQFEDHHSDPNQTTFERIYTECREALTAREWELIFTLFVAQSATVQDLIADAAFCKRHGIRSSASASTKRRELQEQVDTALGKIRKILIN